MTMLDSMRRHRGWLKWSLAFVVLAFGVFFIPQDLLQTTQTTVGAAPREVVAEVDGRTLTAGDYQQRYVVQVQQYRQQFGGSISDQVLRQLGVDQQVLTQMIDEQVAIIEAERHGIRVSDEELAQQIFSIPALQENGRFIGEARYTQILQAQQPPMTRGQFEDNLRRSMLMNKLRSAITDWVTVPDGEVVREFTRRNEKVKLQVVALTADAFRDKVAVTDGDVAAYFDLRKAEYRVGEQRTIKYLLLDRDLQRQKVVVPDADAQRYYNDNLQQYQTPEQIRASHILLNTTNKDEAVVRKQAEDILAKIKGGADFAALATQYSEDEGSKAKGGDLDFFPRGRMVPEFETAAWALQPGQVSDLVKSQFGFHIIKLVEKRAGSTRTLDQVRAQIQQQLSSDIADQQIADQAAKLQARVKNAGDLPAAAAELGLTVQESGAFQREDPVPGLGVAPQVTAAAFRLKDAEVSEPLATPRGVVVIAVAGKQDPYVPKLEEVTDRVRNDLIRTRAAELTRQRAAELVAALKGTSAADFAAVAKKQGFEAKDSELVARGNPMPDIGVSPDVEKVVFGLPVGTVSDPIPTGDGTVIVRVGERDEVTPEELTKGREAFRAELVGERRSRFYASYMNKVKSAMTIEIKPEVLRRILAAQNPS